jgi:hypothetical protein
MTNEEIKPKLTGRCMCGAVQYECDPSAIVFTTICYCRDCQRQSGSAFTANIAVSASAFQVTKGKLKFYERTADNGNKVRMGFCQTCGARVANFSPERKNWAVGVGSLDDSSWFKPMVNVYLASAPAWAPVLKDIPYFNRQD